MLRTIRVSLFTIGLALALAALSGATNLAAQTSLSIDTTTTTTPGTTTGTSGTTIGTAGVTTDMTAGTNGTDLNASPATTSPSLTGTQVQQIVEVTKSVPVASTPLAAFTVPAGSRLVITDVIVTNTGANPTCTVAVGRTSQPSVTGPLCIPAHTTMSLALATGLEFAPGDAVQLANAPDTSVTTTTTATSTASTVSVHLRGFLLASA